MIGCKRDLNTGMVSVLDTWNPGPQGSRTPNILDQDQNGVCTYSAQFENERIICT